MLTRRHSLSLFSWALYDWANSAFAAVIQTFVFAAYFVQSVAPNPIQGSAAWGTVTGVSAFIVAVLSPILGAMADQGGGRKIWIAVFTLICIIPTALMWWIQPSTEFLFPALWAVGIATIGAEGAFIFYNAMLPELSPPSQLGRWSGWGWGMGYAGGMTALIVSVTAFVNTDTPWESLNSQTSAPIRSTFVLTAIWYGLFSLPLFLFTPSDPSKDLTVWEVTKSGLKQLWTTILEIRRYGNIVRFLIAKMFYIDGLATLFAFGGIYATSVFGMEQHEVLQFGIAMNITAGIGATSLAVLDDRLGSRKVILFSLLGLIIPGIFALAIKEKWQFWIVGLIMCFFVGPVQSSSRALMARMAPESLRTQMFGLYMFSGKATAFFGPLLYGWVAFLTGSLRWGMSTIILLFVLGGSILWFLPRKT